MPQTIAILPSDQEGPWWRTRAFRVLLAQVLLLVGGAASVALTAVTFYAIAFMPWPDRVAALRIHWLGYLGLGGLGLIGLVLSSYGFMLGRRSWHLQAGKVVASAEGDEERAAEAVGQAG